MIYLNNKLVPKSKAMISVFDHGFLYGDGVYETLRSYNGVVFMIDEHIERLFRSAEMIGLKLPKTHENIRKAIYRTLTANRQKNAYTRISVSRGPGPIGLDPALCPKPTFVIISNPLKGYPAKYYQKGVKIAVVSTRRNFKNSLNPKIKSLNFLNNILAKIESINRGAYEAIMLNYQGYLAEGTITNIFFVKNNILHTPSLDLGILDGITRRIILDCAKELKIKTKEGRFKREDLYRAREVFISNTTMEVMPVTTVDNKKTGKESGRITRMLHSAYKKYIKTYIREPADRTQKVESRK
ncbi:MAG TPA: branched-chain-amino-acid transaminase [Nitrospirae bacterium]|nr:D-alanine aminotransferase [bacterium BMS3Abin10]GBE37616.1 D-alanine aminotransferase [bacterium BMS3Bbin08]HDH50419.1 branched-chain-amino-acid transaminase [Nitrospirota bacterium]HDK17569.1 branched-chain-amino-acid transaminase [Nitrospirota bacterium]HDK81131.1 branched-chain-amino-acid transaminase [Nitrospirota bacterium]